jgi:hypothetical protein
VYNVNIVATGEPNLTTAVTIKRTLENLIKGRGTLKRFWVTYIQMSTALVVWQAIFEPMWDYHAAASQVTEVQKELIRKRTEELEDLVKTNTAINKLIDADLAQERIMVLAAEAVNRRALAVKKLVPEGNQQLPVAGQSDEEDSGTNMNCEDELAAGSDDDTVTLVNGKPKNGKIE